MKRKSTDKKSHGKLHPINQDSETIESLDPLSDEFAYLVAKYAWSDGLAANAIVRELNLQSTSTNLMRVKRALKRAVKFLTLNPPEEQTLAEKLDSKLNRGRRSGNEVRFTVVKDCIPGHHSTEFLGVVSARAARIAAEIISEAMSQTQTAKTPDIVISNSGGRTISMLVRSLLQHPPVMDEGDDPNQTSAKRLIFVAGNAGYLPSRFNQSANFLSVTMAELYGAEHRALPVVKTEETLAEYNSLVGRTSLFICGVGTCESSLLCEHFETQRLSYPDGAVGDLAFNFLDRDGNEPVLDPACQEFKKTINPGLTTHMISQIAKHKRVLLVLDGEPATAKKQIAIAALRGDYATDVVLGSNLARAILREY